MSIKGEIERAVRLSQRGVRLAKGDQFWRGLSLVTLLSVKGGEVRYRDMFSDRKTGTSRADFLSANLVRVPKPKKEESFLKTLWITAGNKKLPALFRFRYLKSMIDKATDGERDTVSAWMRALDRGREPSG